MGAISKYLRRTTKGYSHWCPACGNLHEFPVDDPQPKRTWTFDGNTESPTFNPSMNASWGWPDKPETLSRCHYKLIAGKIEFQADCTHAMKGQTVPLPELPVGYRD